MHGLVPFPSESLKQPPLWAVACSAVGRGYIPINVRAMNFTLNVTHGCSEGPRPLFPWDTLPVCLLPQALHWPLVPWLDPPHFSLTLFSVLFHPSPMGCPRNQESFALLRRAGLSLHLLLGLGPISVNQKHKQEPQRLPTCHLPSP